MSLSEPGNRADEVAAARAAADARADGRDVPMTERVADLLGERRAHAERAKAARDEQRRDRRTTPRR
jgi:hypothetical protein